MPVPARRARVRAPELAGRGWLGTGGRTLTLAGLRGRVVLLDFWTSCCVNCLHVLDELRDLERDYADVLAVVGVHSPKFEHEKNPQALADAVDRYAVHHPVLDDADLATWSAYAARAWPTLVVVDPQGYVVAQLSGEGHAHGLRVLLDELVAEHEAAGTLRRGDGPYVPADAPRTALRFPGTALRLPGGSYLVADTAHHQLVEVDGDDLATEHRRIGDGVRGLLDGPPAKARFAEPQGLALLPPEVAARVGWDVVVADTVNHALRGLRLGDGAVVTVAGTGTQLRRREGGGPALDQDLSTPWDVAWFDGQVVVAMAGTHQLWALEPAADPRDGLIRVIGGTSAEGLRDGPAEQAWFAQTSGLAASADGGTLWLVDAETSALRRLRRRDDVPVERGAPVVLDARLANAAPAAAPGYEVTTVVGAGLFEFGHVDGPAGQARLQHPLGVVELPDGSVAVADTYDGAVRRYDPATDRVSTLATGLAEPADVTVEAGADGALLVVTESAAHRLVRVPVPVEAQEVGGVARRATRPPVTLAPGALRLEVAFVPPAGQHLDERHGAATRLLVSSSPPGLLAAGEGPGTDLVRDLLLDPSVPAGVLHVSVQAAACDADPLTGEAPEHAACHLYQQDWGLPVVLAASTEAPDFWGADRTLRLDLRGA